MNSYSPQPIDTDLAGSPASVADTDTPADGCRTSERESFVDDAEVNNQAFDLERRNEPDRRQQPTGPGGAFPPAGCRTRCRREAERRRPHFVDRFPPAMLVFVLMLITASMIDAVLTIQLLQEGGNEINPLMDHLLTYGILPFVLGKYVLTAVGMPLLVVFSNHYIFGGRIRIGYLVPIIVVLYMVLIGYQIFLMCQYDLWPPILRLG